MTRAIVFDCFGVLYADNYLQFLDRYFSAEQRAELVALGRAADRGQVSDAEFYAALSAASGQPPGEIRAYLHDTKPFHWGVGEIIRELKPRYWIAMLSNAERTFLEKFLAANHAGQLFDCVLASSETPYLKPQRGIFEELSRRLRLPLEDMVFIDDVEYNTAAAESYGLPSIQYHSPAQLRAELTRCGILPV
jgi:HAD superfamily hydrolase (TIGR01509 family)